MGIMDLFSGKKSTKSNVVTYEKAKEICIEKYMYYSKDKKLAIINDYDLYRMDYINIVSKLMNEGYVHYYGDIFIKKESEEHGK